MFFFSLFFHSFYLFVGIADADATRQIVGHVIKPHGILYSGGPSITGPVAIGLHMEVTLVQLYKVALSAGKAHRDHKHHHVHHFDHNGPATSTLPPPPPPPVSIYFIYKHMYILTFYTQLCE